MSVNECTDSLQKCGRRTEAEVRAMSTDAVKPAACVRMVDAVAALGRKIGITNEDCELVHQLQDSAPAEPLRFE